jgi:phage RecT family recombinase
MPSQRYDPNRTELARTQSSATLAQMAARAMEVLPLSRLRGVEPDVVVRTVQRCLVISPGLRDADARSIVESVMVALSLGLDPTGGVLGQGYLVPFRKGKGRDARKFATFIPGYRGLQELARRVGVSLAAYPVFEDELDAFVLEYGTDTRVVHKPNLLAGADADRALALCYSVAHVPGTPRPNVRHMRRVEIEAIRESSKGAYYDGHKQTDSPWWKYPTAMAVKTMIRAHSKYLPMSPELSYAHALEDGYNLGLAPAEALTMVPADTPDRGPGEEPEVTEVTGTEEEAPEGAEPGNAEGGWEPEPGAEELPVKRASPVLPPRPDLPPTTPGLSPPAAAAHAALIAAGGIQNLAGPPAEEPAPAPAKAKGKAKAEPAPAPAAPSVKCKLCAKPVPEVDASGLCPNCAAAAAAFRKAEGNRPARPAARPAPEELAPEPFTEAEEPAAEEDPSAPPAEPVPPEEEAEEPAEEAPAPPPAAPARSRPVPLSLSWPELVKSVQEYAKQSGRNETDLWGLLPRFKEARGLTRMVPADHAAFIAWLQDGAPHTTLPAGGPPAPPAAPATPPPVPAEPSAVLPDVTPAPAAPRKRGRPPKQKPEAQQQLL